MPLQATSGAASYDAFGGGVPVVPNFIEDVFSCFLYTGNGSTQTITNGIDFSTKGGLLWLKARNDTRNNYLYDTTRSIANALRSDSTAGVTSTPDALTAFNNNGFSIGTSGNINTSGNTLVSWSFRKQPKFFDVVTWTADDSGTGQAVPHNLGSIPGCIIVKATSASSNWFTWHIASGITVARSGFQLNSTAASALSVNSTGQMTSTEFFSGQLFDSSFGRPVTDGTTYVAYLFAHDAGGFGLTGTDNVISCGSFSVDGAASFSVNLGYEPQWLMIKSTNNTGVSSIRQNWLIYDTMRGLVAQPDSVGGSVRLFPNLSNAESASNELGVTATGFNSIGNQNPSTGPYIYIAIRRGPMKVPTDATKVFAPIALAYQAAGTQATTNFPVDLAWWKNRDGGQNGQSQDRLRGLPNTDGVGAPTLFLDSTAAEDPNQYKAYEFWNTGFRAGGGSADRTQVWWTFRRAPSYFDEVCYTGTGTYGATNHNLGVTPELVIYKSRSNAVNWGVIKPVSSIAYYDGLLNSNSAFTYYSNDPSVAGLYTSTQFAKYQDTSSYTYVAYLFATCAGVSKVGSYTGTGTTLQIDCGFTAGARFVLIKRADSTGGWFVWDSARGIVSGNDPYLLLNSTAAEVTNTDYIDTYSAGFEISSTAPSAINASGGTFIFLAIA